MGDNPSGGDCRRPADYGAVVDRRRPARMVWASSGELRVLEQDSRGDT